MFFLIGVSKNFNRMIINVCRGRRIYNNNNNNNKIPRSSSCIFFNETFDRAKNSYLYVFAKNFLINFV